MTRKKEIEQESFKVYPEKLGYSTIIEKTVDYNREKREIWIAGAEWADAHPSTLEVKNVDLEKESMNYLLNEHKSPLNDIMHAVDLRIEMQYHKDIQDAFKAGFKKAMEE